MKAESITRISPMKQSREQGVPLAMDTIGQGLFSVKNQTGNDLGLAGCMASCNSAMVMQRQPEAAHAVLGVAVTW